jgi:hypothetical protein
MKLYSAKIDDIAKPVVDETEQVKQVKEKKPRSEKQIAALEKAKEARKRKREEIESKKEEIKQKEKEIEEAVDEAVAKKIKKVEKVQESTPSITSEEEAPVKKSRKQAKPKQVPQKSEVDIVASAPGSPVERSKRPAVAEDVHEPPAWFKTFIANTKAEEAKLSKPKKPRKQVRQEAEAMAQHKWQDSHTRDRVNTQADNHMRQMHQLYGQIFRR